MKYIILFSYLILFNYVLSAQTKLFTPQEIIKAYNKDTRTTDGKQGKNFWQNHSDYQINVTVNTKENLLEGKENIIYHNNSPVDLDIIVFRMYQDFSIPEKSRDWDIRKEDFGDGVNLKTLIINGEEIDLANTKIASRPGTNLIVKLKNKLASRTSNEIFAEWSFKIPNMDFPRMGKYDSSTYLIAYWYPQISVYDDIDGWDFTDYKGIVEFYNDFSDFDVNIKTDRDNMVVWATGVLQNPEEIFSDELLKKYNLDSGNVISKQDIQNGIKFLKQGKNTTYHYKAYNVPDFVFAMSDHYSWDRETAEVAPGKFTKINAAYNPDSHWFKYVSKIDKAVILFLSKDFPGVPFPFPSMTIFNGEGGMEYPMFVNDGTTDEWPSTVYLTAHETTHSYFPFYMGINERKYAWMDEGWAVYLPMEFQMKMSKDNPENIRDSLIDVKTRSVNYYLRVAGTFYDIPALAPSNVIKSPSYRNNAYSKAAVIYDVLRDMLGDDIFKKTLREFMQRWNGKHPTPYDFFNTFNDVAGNMDWFWNKWFMTYAKPDLMLHSSYIDDKILHLNISNEGGLPLPVELRIELENGKIINIHKTAEVWKDGNYMISIDQNLESPMKFIKLGNSHIPDVHPEDNELK